jgi:hypothetical protein
MGLKKNLKADYSCSPGADFTENTASSIFSVVASARGSVIAAILISKYLV